VGQYEGGSSKIAKWWGLAPPCPGSPVKRFQAKAWDQRVLGAHMIREGEGEEGRRGESTTLVEETLEGDEKER